MIRPYASLPPENHHISDMTDCDWWGHLPPDSLGLCGDCGEPVPKERQEDYDDSD